jgi:hypothetical protein
LHRAFPTVPVHSLSLSLFPFPDLETVKGVMMMNTNSCSEPVVAIKRPQIEIVFC